MVRAVDQDDAGRGALERFGCRQSAEATADDYNCWDICTHIYEEAGRRSFV